MAKVYLEIYSRVINCYIDCINDSISITATPNKGYHFTQWSDGNTENPRTIVITQDTTFTAEFAPNPTYNVTLSAENGIVTGAGTYNQGDTITITATANKGYKFKEWSDGNTDNPRIIVVTEAIELTAIFEELGLEGQEKKYLLFTNIHRTV